jgi:hypothetical protein
LPAGNFPQQLNARQHRPGSGNIYVVAKQRRRRDRAVRRVSDDTSQTKMIGQRWYRRQSKATTLGGERANAAVELGDLSNLGNTSESTR